LRQGAGRSRREGGARNDLAGADAGPDAGGNILTYWLELASGVVAASTKASPVARIGLDLGHWIGVAAALAGCPGKAHRAGRPRGDRALSLARWEWREAGSLIETAAPGLQDEGTGSIAVAHSPPPPPRASECVIARLARKPHRDARGAHRRCTTSACAAAVTSGGRAGSDRAPADHPLP